MPPKDGRGRGAGGGGRRPRRGRGGSTATPAHPPPPDSIDAPEVPPESNALPNLQPETERQPTVTGSPLHAQTETATPQNTQDDAMDLDPNSSPATQPTETPAPTPVRAPPQTPILPPTASTSGTKAKAKPSKFKPKNVRSNAAELKEIEKKEQARIAALNASNARQLGRGNLLRSRGRGDAMGRGRMTTSGGADGVFGIAPVSG